MTEVEKTRIVSTLNQRYGTTMRVEDYELGIDQGLTTWRLLREEARPSITCPVCHRTSYNANDITNRYCGACHWFHDDPIPEAMP
jgi:hypothetical protein